MINNTNNTEKKKNTQKDFFSKGQCHEIFRPNTVNADGLDYLALEACRMEVTLQGPETYLLM